MSISRALLIAAAFGVLVSLVANGCKVAFTDYNPEPDEWLAYALMSAFPFAVLAVFKFWGWTTWLLAMLLTVGAWGAYLVEGIPQLASQGSIDMGAGFLVMTSPVWITIAGALAGLMFGRGR